MSDRTYKYGSRSTVEIVLAAVRSLENELQRAVSMTKIKQRIVAELADFVPSNVDANLAVLSVNNFGRGNFSGNFKPRTIKAVGGQDQLFKSGKGQDARYETYDPSIHGIWELADNGSKVLRPRFLGTLDSLELESAQDAAAGEGLFNFDIDARRRALVAIAQRDGQPAFRQSLLRAYEGACVISGCTIAALLEAAHIVPYRGPQTNAVGNGLLLRADLHKLFDLHLFCIDRSLTVRLSRELQQSEYAQFEGVRIRAPLEHHMEPIAGALLHHHERCSWMKSEVDGEVVD